MTIFKINHVTTYDYSESVSVCHNQVMLTPFDDVRTECTSHRLIIRPTPTQTTRCQDIFGNHVHRFSVEKTHRRLTITATSRVSVVDATNHDINASCPWSAVRDGIANQSDGRWFDSWIFLRNSPRICCGAGFEQYARQCFGVATPVLQGLRDLTALIHSEFEYDTSATDVETSAHSAFEQRKGVCQDFAHVQISCLRSIGIPARYVSGYLRTMPPPGKPRLVGADQSHAWVSAYCGDPIGWVDVDPTNNMLAAIDHIPIAIGRDYGDVAPIRGVFVGGGKHVLKVSVDVCPE